MQQGGTPWHTSRPTFLYTREYRDDAVNMGKAESFPYYPATAFGATAFEEIKTAYRQGYTYIRTNNPDRDVLAGLMTRLEAPELEAASTVLSSGMAAITATATALLQSGDHILSNRCLYGETIELFDFLFGKFGVETTYKVAELAQSILNVEYDAF